MRGHFKFFQHVLILGFTAFGGPQAHIALMMERLVMKKKYLTEAELIELNALCQLLPGPSSTQTITAIGYKRGGVLVALVTLFIWALPATLFMTLLSLLMGYWGSEIIPMKVFRFVQPMAIGFIAFAGVKISKSLIKTDIAMLLCILGIVACVVIRSPWLFPIAIITGGFATNFFGKDEQPTYAHPKLKINWTSIWLLAGFFIVSGVVALTTKYKPIILFENFYRFGSLIFGGGYVLIPMMYEQFVTHREYLTSQEFLSGYGVAQGLPGPVFAFAAFTGGMALKSIGLGHHLLGSAIGAIAIFLPGTLAIFFVYPFWEYLKSFKVFRRSLEGVNAISVGLIIAAAIILFQSIPFDGWNLGVVVLTYLLLQLKWMPAPLIVLLALLVGIFIP